MKARIEPFCRIKLVFVEKNSCVSIYKICLTKPFL